MASRHQSQPSPGQRHQQQLQRRLGVLDSTAIGLGSMLGAGVFVVFAPAAALAGPLLAAAFTLPARPWHAVRWLFVLGFLGCLLLAGRFLVLRLRLRKAGA